VVKRSIARDGGRRLIADIWRKLFNENRGQVVGTAAFFGKGFVMVFAYARINRAAKWCRVK
jgi:hypothetical protein